MNHRSEDLTGVLPLGRHARVNEIMVDLCARALLATDHATVHWLLGREATPGTSVLVTADCVVTIEPALDGGGNAPALEGLTGHHPVAVETAALPSLCRALLHGHPLVDASARLAGLRLVHSDSDLVRIRAAAEFASRAQDLLRGHLEAGIAEDELFGWLDEELCEAGTTSIVDLMFGERCSEVGLPPTKRRLAPGETVIFDFAPLLDGFWGDSCSTSVIGSAPRNVQRAHDFARRALATGIAMLRPGQTVGAVDRAVRGVMEAGGYPDYPHMTGHGIGYKQQDHPLFDPRSSVVLEAGSVIAIEPGVYLDDFGVRVEHLMLVDDAGCTLLTTHDLALNPA